MTMDLWILDLKITSKMFLILFEDDEQDDKEVVHTWIFWSSTVDIWKDLDIWTFYFEDDEQDEARGGENGSEFDILGGNGGS